jgi:HAD superfamily hydrolase (TIGR01457 family)
MLADRYDVFLFDLDGVLYRGNVPVPHAPEALTALRAAGKGIAFVTNNSAATPQTVAERLRSVGVGADPAEVETSAITTAHLLAGRGVRTAFVVGEEGVRSALTERGIRIQDDPGGDGVDVVVVGLDRHADYAKLRRASVLVQRGASLVATNPDGSFPAADGQIWPGAGALLAAIEATTGVTAEVVGKPHAPILLAALERAGGGVPLLVGDRLDTDIAGAAALDWDSLLVMTGITTPEELAGSPIRPSYVGDDLRVLSHDPAPWAPGGHG